MNSATQTLSRASAPGADGGEPAGARDAAGGEARAEALRRAAEVERSAGRHQEALSLYEEAARLLADSSDRAPRGPLRAAYANLLAFLGEAEGRDDYLERAAAEYAAAAEDFGRGGHARRQAAAEQQLARLCLVLNRPAEGHEHLDRALALLGGGADAADRARLDETRARLRLAEGLDEEAEELSRGAVAALEPAGDSSPLAAALTARGVALARLARYEEARDALRRAAAVGMRAGDAAAEGYAALAFVEELGEQLPVAELAGSFERAASLLTPAQSLSLNVRLVACARPVIARAAAEEEPRGWEGFSFKEAVHRFEAGVIGRALADSAGSVSRAAHLLGFRHHNSLASIINNRHRELLGERSPIRPRRRSIITVRERGRSPRFADAGPERAASVLHVEDDHIVANAVRLALEAEGWRVETCADGADALERLRRANSYDLLLLDYDLPGLDGLALARAARALPHRSQTPIIMFSATDHEREALPAGVNLFLHKPQDGPDLPAAAKRLLTKKSRQ